MCLKAQHLIAVKGSKVAGTLAQRFTFSITSTRSEASCCDVTYSGLVSRFGVNVFAKLEYHDLIGREFFDSFRNMRSLIASDARVQQFISGCR